MFGRKQAGSRLSRYQSAANEGSSNKRGKDSDKRQAIIFLVLIGATY